MQQTLTDRKFWQNYWESKKGLIFNIPRNYQLGKLIARKIQGKGIETAIELGGFPGYYAIWLKKYFGIKTALLDYFIHPQTIRKLLKANGLNESDIAIIETNLFNLTPDARYDLVLSSGLIEHFKDTADIIAKHVQFLKPEGMLLIIIPNFRGINGWVQKTFDIENYNKHNIDCMDPKLLADIAKKLELKEVKSSYYGGFSVWLENKDQKPALTKAFVKLVWIAGKIIAKTFRFESKLLSPYIVVEGQK